MVQAKQSKIKKKVVGRKKKIFFPGHHDRQGPVL
jgi:hypothetical protein